MIMSMFILLVVIQVLSLNEAFNFSCPSQAQWKLRAKSMCKPARNYTCLFDLTRKVNAYRDRCSEPRIMSRGNKYVFQPNLNKATCSITRYQPFIFETVGYSNCIFLKSLCNSEGQKAYGNGSTTSDRTCLCDNMSGYTFVKKPGSQSYCNPISEDCSCYFNIHPNNKPNCSKDFKCSVDIDIIQNHSVNESFDISQSIRNTAFDNYRYNLVFPQNEYRTAACVSIIFVSFTLAVLVVCILHRICQQHIQTNILISETPAAIGLLSEEDQNKFIQLMASSEKEKRYFLRIMIVGREKVGKTCLLKRLLKESTAGVRSTDGVEIIVRQCKINIQDGKWVIGKDEGDDVTHRIIRAVANPERRENEKVLFSRSIENPEIVSPGDKLITFQDEGDDKTHRTNNAQANPERREEEKVLCSRSIENPKIVSPEDKLITFQGGNSHETDIDEGVDQTQRTNNAQANPKRRKNKKVLFSRSIENPEIVPPGDKLIIFQGGNSNESDIGKNKDITTKPLEIAHMKSNEDNIDMKDMSNQPYHEDGMLNLSQTKNENVESEKSDNYHNLVFNNDNNASSMTKYEKDETEMKNDSSVTQINTKNHSIESSKKSSLEMPPDIMSDVLSAPSSSDSSNKCQYASCGLWDFAGQSDFYATHQAFLTSSAIYILVTDMDADIEKQDMHQHFAEFKNVAEYVDFWFDSIHCYRTVEQTKNEPTDPPVILVFTGKDKYEKATFMERKEKLNEQLIQAIAGQNKFRHFRHKCFLSNTEDPDEEFENLRQKISDIAQKMSNWGESMPLRWILLEHLIDIIKRRQGKSFISFDDMVNIAKHPQIAISDINEVLLFLRFQNEVGNIIYFDDIRNLIILDPQWLANAFRCLVSHKLDVNDVSANICSDWTKLKKTGEISYILIRTLFKLKGGNQFVEQIKNLIEVMERFDILVNMEDTDSYMMPSMMPISSFETVCNDIGICAGKCQRSSWFCLKFSFLPPAFFNHLSAWLMKRYKPSRTRDDSDALALYRGICVFNFHELGCDKLLMTMSTDTIALQVVSFASKQKNLGNLCTEVRKELVRKIDGIKKRYKLKISYEERFKCGDGQYYINTLSFEDLKTEEYIYCLQHKSVHECKGIYIPWTMVQFTEEEISYLRIVALLHVAEDAVRIVFDSEFHPDVLYKEVNKVKYIIKKYLNRYQWETLCNTRKGDGKASSRTFDLHLMLCFLKNTIYTSISNEYNEFCSSTSAALSNIWHCRTQLSKNVNGQLAKEDFQRYWSITYGAIKLFGKHSQNSLTLKCSRIENCDLDDTSEILQTETNYLRILHLILHVAREVFQEYFDKEFFPSTLQQTIKSNKRMLQELTNEERLITSYQLDLLFSNKAKSDSLDMRTMAMLMVHIKKLNIMLNGLAIDDSSTDNRADLSRILWYRRQVMYRNQFTMDEFDDQWNKISEAVQRLGGAIYATICKQLKTAPLHASEP